MFMAVAALAVTAGCGDSSSTAQDPGRDPASDPAGLPSRSPGIVKGADVLPLISLTGAGGRPETTSTQVRSTADLRSFARQFRVPAMWQRLRTEIGDRLSDPDHELVAQIVTVGCDRPPGVDVLVNGDGDVVLAPHEVAKPLDECLAPVTTVAVAVLPID
jgi:hypothetical protein